MHPIVSVVDYGIGNIGSVLNMLKRVGYEASAISNPLEVGSASRLILPGVGSYDNGVRLLRATGWDDAVRQHVASERPLLGICLGMQLLLDSSEEGNLPGLGFIPGAVKHFSVDPKLPIPHMGWNFARPVRRSPLFEAQDREARYYFVHSYYAAPSNPEHISTLTPYGPDFASAISNQNVFGTQFHPEKSHSFGMGILESFGQL